MERAGRNSKEKKLDGPNTEAVANGMKPNSRENNLLGIEDLE